MQELSNDLVGDSDNSELESGESLREGVGVGDCVVSRVVIVVLGTIVLSMAAVRGVSSACLAREKGVAARMG